MWSKTKRRDILSVQNNLINELLELYRPGHSHKTVIKIGERKITVYAFHYPSHSFAFSIKSPTSKVLSFIDKNDTQLLRKWTIKAIVVVTVKQVSHFSDIIIIHCNPL
jgi:hypothetical protein